MSKQRPKSRSIRNLTRAGWLLVGAAGATAFLLPIVGGNLWLPKLSVVPGLGVFAGGMIWT